MYRVPVLADRLLARIYVYPVKFARQQKEREYFFKNIFSKNKNSKNPKFSHELRKSSQSQQQGNSKKVYRCLLGEIKNKFDQNLG